MTMDTNFMIVYVSIFLSGVICFFMACVYRKAELRKRGDRHRKRFGLRFWRSKSNNRYQWADSPDKAARLSKLTPSSEPDLEILNLYLKEPIELTEEYKRRSNVTEAAIEAEKELIAKRKAMRDAPSTSKHYTRRDKRNEPKPHLEIQVDPITEQARRRHSMELNVQPAYKVPKGSKVRYHKKFTARTQCKSESDIQLKGDTIKEELNVKPAFKVPKGSKVRYHKKFTTRTQCKSESDIQLEGDTINVIDEKDFEEHIV